MYFLWEGVKSGITRARKIQSYFYIPLYPCFILPPASNSFYAQYGQIIIITTIIIITIIGVVVIITMSHVACNLYKLLHFVDYREST